ncbi:MAG: MaoC like domain protein [Frankiales bacterium]|nr:MaoC like domain protein [Frankiales bacterium]
MSDQVHFEDVTVGDAVPAGTETPSQLQMFFFSAATYNGHRIHYDHPFAVGVEGHPDVVVQGPLQVAVIARTLTDWVSPDGRLVSLSLQNRASAYPGEELRIQGTVVAKREEDGRCLVDVELTEEKGEGVLLIPATATVSLPRRAPVGTGA